MRCLTCHGLITNGNCGCSTGTQGAASVNIDTMLRDRDAEIAELKARAEKAEAANAEMRAALERHVCQHAECSPIETHAGCAARALLARTDLGRGMVAVPREVMERIGKYAREDRMVTPGSTRLARLLADLAALLDGGKGRG